MNSRCIVLVLAASLIGAAPAGAASTVMPMAGGSDNSPPLATIRMPVDGSFYIPAGPLPLSGLATDREDATADLQMRWDVRLVRDGQVVQELYTGDGATGSLVVEPGQVTAGAMIEVLLTVADKGGLTHTARAMVQPRLDDTQVLAIAPGDVVEIEIHAGGARQEQFTSQISPAGTLTGPLVGEIGVAGLTALELSTKLRELLGRDYYVDPQVLVTVKATVKKVFISGEIRQPGAYGIQEGLTVLNACILAGGFTHYAAANRVKVTRSENGRTRMVVLDLTRVQKGKGRDLVLQSGDRIEVPHRLF